eukprot:5837070-Prymnesium_polylepis.2
MRLRWALRCPVEVPPGRRSVTYFWLLSRRACGLIGFHSPRSEFFRALTSLRVRCTSETLTGQTVSPSRAESPLRVAAPRSGAAVDTRVQSGRTSLLHRNHFSRCENQSRVARGAS